MGEEYIVYHPYEGVIYGSLSKDDTRKLNTGDKLFLHPENHFLYNEKGEVVCFWKSHLSCHHCVYNGDGHGEERGKIVYKIVNEPRRVKSEIEKGLYRFTDKQVKTIQEKYSQFIQDTDFALIFNEQLNRADIETLRIMINDLKLTM